MSILEIQTIVAPVAAATNSRLGRLWPQAMIVCGLVFTIAWISFLGYALVMLVEQLN